MTKRWLVAQKSQCQWAETETNSLQLNQLPPKAFQNPLSISLAVTPAHALLIYRIFGSHSYSYLAVCMYVYIRTHIHTQARESLFYSPAARVVFSKVQHGAEQSGSKASSLAAALIECAATLSSSVGSALYPYHPHIQIWSDHGCYHLSSLHCHQLC